MADLIYPPYQVEKYLLDGTGTFVLAPIHRQARALNIVFELVRLENYPLYYDFRLPEPRTFWGYIQLMERDFVRQTITLAHRRQTILEGVFTSPDEIEQLRCLIRDFGIEIFDLVVPLALAGGADANEIGTRRAQLLLRTAQARLLPVRPETAIWYEIAPGFAAAMTITWASYPAPCGDIAGLQPIPRAPAPGKGDSAPDADGGGGIRPFPPAPPGNSADPDSDSPAPPPDTPGGPDIPTPAPPPAPAQYRVTYQNRICIYSSSSDAYGMQVSGATLTGPGPFTLVSRPAANGTLSYFLVDALGNENPTASGIGPSSAGCPEQSRTVIVSQEPIGTDAPPGD